MLEVLGQGLGLPALHHAAVDQVGWDRSQSSHDQGTPLTEYQAGLTLQLSDGEAQ